MHQAEREAAGGDGRRRDPGAGLGATFQGLGPKSQQWLAAIGITTAEQRAQQDPFAVWARLKAAQPGVSLNRLYALIGAVEHPHWRDVARGDRTRVPMRLQDMGLM